MNIVRIPRLLKHSTLLLAALGSSLLLSACGGDSNKSSNSSSSSSSTSSHTFSSTPVTPPLSGTWPDVKVSASGTKTLKFDWTAPTADTIVVAYYKLFKKADSSSDFVQVGSDFTANSVSDPVSVHLTDWVNSRYKVQACDAASVCKDSTVIVTNSAMLSAITYVKASNAETNDWFGWSVAISGDGKTMAVGAPIESSNATGLNGNETNNTSPGSGAVYVFAKVNGNWVQEAYLKASNTEQPNDNPLETLPNDRFGYQVSLSSDGNTLAVSAINEDSPSYGINCNQANYVDSVSYSSNSSTHIVKEHRDYDIGAIYIFKRTNANWLQTAYVKPQDTLNYAVAKVALGFGTRMALSGDGKTLAVGNTLDSYQFGGVEMAPSSASASSQACFEYYPSSVSSSSVSSLSSSSSSTSSSSSSNSSSSSIILGGSYSGSVYLFKETDSGWQQQALIKASNAGPGDYFGESLALSHDGNSLAVGAPGEDSKDATAADEPITLEGLTDLLNTGAVYVYQHANEKWTEQAKVKPTKNEWLQSFGASVALSADGNTLAVGTPGDWSKSQGVNSDSSNYTLEALLSCDPAVGRCSISPKVGSSYSGGAVYIFAKSNTTWNQQAYIKPNLTRSGYKFGSFVSLAGNGNTLAVGSWIDSSQATGINGDELDVSSSNSGAAYLFTRTGTTWSQKSYIKAPNTNENDRFGRALGLDDLGESLVIGAYKESSKAAGINGDKVVTPTNTASGSGAVYIY